MNVWPRLELHDEADCCWTISDLRFPLFNSVMRARVGEDDADALIDGRVAACRDRGVPMLWWTGPSTSPGDLGQRLLDRGFLLEPATGMTATLDAQAATDPSVQVERVGDQRTLGEWSHVLCQSFAAPAAFGQALRELANAAGLDEAAPFQHFLARQRGTPVGTSSLFVGGAVAGIYDVSTLPEVRRRGIGAAITRAAMAEAWRRGCRTAILHASDLGLSMYRAIGFRAVCDIGQYVWTPHR
ncbi:MAG TPA: GNAT family N-acetyltransferase [Vicinamibacterales bacterium]|nr:GNAT family N-acetyltransferase [Vicinamibacterales bacterium]